MEGRVVLELWCTRCGWCGAEREPVVRGVPAQGSCPFVQVFLTTVDGFKKSLSSITATVQYVSTPDSFLCLRIAPQTNIKPGGS